MEIRCGKIPITEQVMKALYGKNPELFRVQSVGKIKIPGFDALKPCVLPVFYQEHAQQIESLLMRDDDVIVASFPKSGTTWLQEMVWLIANNLDFNKAKQLSMNQRYAFLEYSGITDSIKTINSVTKTDALGSPRFIKTHLPVGLLPTNFWRVKPKLIYIARNPKDIAISYYHHYLHLNSYKGTLEDFLDSFLSDLVLYSSVHDHVLDYWRLRDHQNILFITYEEMSTNLDGVIRKVSNFMGVEYGAHEIAQLVKHLAFDAMRQNDSVNYKDVVKEVALFYGDIQTGDGFEFYRRGQMNSHVDEMPAAYQQKFDEWTAARFAGTDLKFN